MDLHPMERETLRRLDKLTKNMDRFLTPQAIYLEDLEGLENLENGEEDEWD